jgi:aspartyl protease family protein
MKQILYILLFCVSLSGCSGCSQSGRKSAHVSTRSSSRRENSINSEKQFSNGDRTVIKMQKVGGVYQIPVDVNGVKMSFIFDTGASIISISQTEAMFLYKQGKLTSDDIKGTANYSDANGNISEGTIIELKEIKIGNRTLNNVEASVVGNLTAPLLFGQSALGKFGKISIDNSRGEVTFE